VYVSCTLKGAQGDASFLNNETWTRVIDGRDEEKRLSQGRWQGKARPKIFQRMPTEIYLSRTACFITNSVEFGPGRSCGSWVSRRTYFCSDRQHVRSAHSHFPATSESRARVDEDPEVVRFLVFTGPPVRAETRNRKGPCRTKPLEKCYNRRWP